MRQNYSLLEVPLIEAIISSDFGSLFCSQDVDSIIHEKIGVQK